MDLKILLLFDPLNFYLLSTENKNKMIEKIKLNVTKNIQRFEYKKASKRYLNRAKLYKQVVNKALSLAYVFYLDYLFSVLFDKIISYSISSQDILCILKFNKSSKNNRL